MTEEKSKYFLGYLKGDAPFTGVCRDGPYDGQTLSWNSPTYEIVMCMSTAELPPETLAKAFEDMRRYNYTRYKFEDSTWTWVKP